MSEKQNRDKNKKPEALSDDKLKGASGGFYAPIVDESGDNLWEFGKDDGTAIGLAENEEDARKASWALNGHGGHHGRPGYR